MGRVSCGSLSRAGHEKSCLNVGGPPSKPKYSSMTDSEQVPCGKGEKHPDKGSEIDPETECLQAVGGGFFKSLCDLANFVLISRQ